MLRNTADCQADVDRFIGRVVESETVWYLASENGTAFCESNSEEDEDQEEPPTVLLFFSDAAYARRSQNQHFAGYQVTRMDLFDFLYRWLPGMTDDRILAGPNWSGDLVGLEIPAYLCENKLRVP
jgi:hypothetical protein